MTLSYPGPGRPAKAAMMSLALSADLFNRRFPVTTRLTFCYTIGTRLRQIETIARPSLRSKVEWILN